MAFWRVGGKQLHNVYRNDIQVACILGEAAEAAALGTHIARSMNDYDAMCENLTATQTRCTELLEETRRLKRENAELRRVAGV